MSPKSSTTTDGPDQPTLNRFTAIIEDIGPVDMTPGTDPAPWAEPDGTPALDFASAVMPESPTQPGSGQ